MWSLPASLWKGERVAVPADCVHGCYISGCCFHFVNRRKAPGIFLLPPPWRSLAPGGWPRLPRRLPLQRLLLPLLPLRLPLLPLLLPLQPLLVPLLLWPASAWLTFSSNRLQMLLLLLLLLLTLMQHSLRLLRPLMLLHLLLLLLLGFLLPLVLLLLPPLLLLLSMLLLPTTTCQAASRQSQLFLWIMQKLPTRPCYMKPNPSAWQRIGWAPHGPSGKPSSLRLDRCRGEGPSRLCAKSLHHCCLLTWHRWLGQIGCLRSLQGVHPARVNGSKNVVADLQSDNATHYTPQKHRCPRTSTQLLMTSRRVISCIQ